MNIETMTQTEVKEPPYRQIAEAVSAVAASGQELGMDQETIRVMLHAFMQTAQQPHGVGNLALGACEKQRHY